MMAILEHNTQGATIRLDQRELLLAMALVQEGRESFGCNTVSGKALDDLFCSANVLVEVARRNNEIKAMVWQKPRRVTTLGSAAHAADVNEKLPNRMSWFKRF